MTPPRMDAAPAPLNLFQRLMLQWDRLHPYNAGQILKLAGPGDATAIETAWREALAAIDFGSCAPGVRHAPPGQSLSDFVSAELNRPFHDPREPPWRPFVYSQSDHHYVGIVYHHYAADSVSIRLLLREWFLRLYAPAEARGVPLRNRGAPYGAFFGPRRARWSVAKAMLSAVRWANRNRHIARVNYPNSDDFASRFIVHDLGDGLVPPLLEYARAHGATLNDLFLAVVAQVCHRFVPLVFTSRRPDMALGTIVDLRPYASQDLSETFGLYLGFTSVTCRPADLDDFPRLLRAIAAQSRADKEGRVALHSPVRMLAALAVGTVYSRPRLVEFYRKRVPLAGGISNINLNRDWPARFHPSPLLDYVRVSPTGPMMPLVFTPTTLGDHLHVGFTYRSNLIDDRRAKEMTRDFDERLRALARTRRADAPAPGHAPSLDFPGGK